MSLGSDAFGLEHRLSTAPCGHDAMQPKNTERGLKWTGGFKLLIGLLLILGSA
jgi:hypothetical protein